MSRQVCISRLGFHEVARKADRSDGTESVHMEIRV